MGYPSKGCEALYRNSLCDTNRYFSIYHNKVKVYNLCLEKNRIYPKEDFEGKLVAWFPFTDHDPCSIKYIYIYY